MVAEQALGGLVQRQDAAGQIERDGAVARPVEHRLKVAARQTAGGRRLALGDAHSRPELRFQRAAQRDQRRRRAVPSDHLRVAVDGQDLPVRPHDRDRADVFGRHRLRIAVAEHSGERVRRLKFCEIAIADELEQRPIGVERLPVAGDQRADRKTVQNRAGVAPNLVVVGAARRRSIALPVRRLLGARVDSEFPSVVRARPFVRGVVARSRRTADQSARDFPERVALAAAELHALGGKAWRGFAGQRIKRARADRNDVGRDGGRRMAQDVNRGGALGRRRLRLARRGALGEIRLLSLRHGRVGVARLGEGRSGLRSVRLERSLGGGASGALAAGSSRFGSTGLAALSAAGPRLQARSPATRWFERLGEGGRGLTSVRLEECGGVAPRWRRLETIRPALLRFRAAGPRLQRIASSASTDRWSPAAPPTDCPRTQRRPRSPRPTRQSRDSPKIRDDGRTSARRTARSAGADQALRAATRG